MPDFTTNIKRFSAATILSSALLLFLIQPSIDLLTIGWIKKSSSALDNIVAAENRLMLVVKSGMVEHGTAKRV
jgi:hypothetical protein